MCAFPTTFVPTVPAANVCPSQVHKKLTGRRIVDWVANYPCVFGATRRGRLTLDVALSSMGGPCDQEPGLIPNGSRLRASGWVICREDGLADYTGRFAIVRPDGVVIFRGAINLLDQVGTHQAPFGGEPCNLERHVEGWLSGLDAPPPDAHRSLHLQIVARGLLPAADGAADLGPGYLNGVCLKG